MEAPDPAQPGQVDHLLQPEVRQAHAADRVLRPLQAPVQHPLGRPVAAADVRLAKPREREPRRVAVASR